MPHRVDREHLASFILSLRAGGHVPPRVMEAVEAVPRHLFTPPGIENVYADHAFPIACGQTMPSARTAVRIVSALKVQPESRILEIGTGSGYITALLARMGLQVVTLDRYRTLLAEAADRLWAASILNVTFVQEDGRGGSPEQAPFDRILVNGSFESLPKTFVDQIAQQGILLAAVGEGKGEQMMMRHQKLGSRFEEEPLFPIRQQPLEFGTAAVL
jgi:protein-L-isoaspartate(D-aspartate) O-methyltransferase